MTISKAQKQRRFVERMHELEKVHPNRFTSPLLHLPAEVRNIIYPYIFNTQRIDLKAHWCLRNDIDEIDHDTYDKNEPRKDWVRPKFKGKFEQLPRVCRQLYVETRRYAITTSELVVRRSALGGIIKQLNKASMMSRERRDLLRNVRFVNDVVSDCDAECQCKRMFLRDWKRLEECLVWMKLIERVVVEVKGKPKGVSDIVLGFVREFGGCERSCVDFVPLRLNGVVVELDVL